MPAKDTAQKKSGKNDKTADKDSSGNDLKALVAASRKNALRIGFCLGAKPDDSIVLMHRTKTAASLLRDARKMGKTQKFGSGTVMTSGRNFIITMHEDVVRNTPFR